MVSIIWGIQKRVKGNKVVRRKNTWEISERETEHDRLITLGNELGGDGRGGGLRVGVTGLRALTGALNGMSTGSYSLCWKIEQQ